MCEGGMSWVYMYIGKGTRDRPLRQKEMSSNMIPLPNQTPDTISYSHE